MTTGASHQDSQRFWRMRCPMVCLLLFFLGIDQQVSSFSNAVFTSNTQQSGDAPLRTLVHNGGGRHIISPASVTTTTFWNKYPSKLASDNQIILIDHKSFRRSAGAVLSLQQSSTAHESVTATTRTSTTTSRESSAKRTTLLPSSAVTALPSLDVFRSSISTVCNSLSQAVSERYTTSTAAAWAHVLVACSTLSSISLTSTSVSVWQACKTLWWAMPLSLCLVPVYCSMVLQTAIGTPHWWKMVEMQYIRDSPDAALVIGFFLLSNICYLFSGLYLLLLRHFSSSLLLTNNTDNSNKNALSIISWPLALLTTLLLKATITMPSSHSTSSSPSNSSSSSFGENTASSLSKGTLMALRLQQPRTGLAFWILTSGLVSTIFHSFQAMSGSAEASALAEALCFVDHGVAGASVLYFWNVCGRPRRSTVVVGVAGLVALALPLRPGYAWLHSLWHFLSATAALLWAFQKHIPATSAAMLVDSAATTTVLGASSTTTTTRTEHKPSDEGNRRSPQIPEIALPIRTTA